MATAFAEESASAFLQKIVNGPSPFPPCTIPASELQPTTISQMQIGSHHLGKRTVIRVMPRSTIPIKQVLLAAVMDQEDSLANIQLYATCRPFEEVLPANKALRADTWYLIKQPLLLRGQNGRPHLAVVHPGDIIMLLPDDEFIPAGSRLGKNAYIGMSAQIRLMGNDAVGEKRWVDAEALYSIAVRTAETAEETTLAYLNRSLANLRLGRPALALADAIKSNETNSTTPTEKGLFREVSALYDLAKFDQCLNKLQVLTAAFPTNTSAIPMIARVQERLKEQQTGQYSFRRMYKQAEAMPPLIDCATYTMPVEIRDSPGKGRGVFTKRNVLAGELLICEKAFGYAFEDKDRPGAGIMTERDLRAELVTQIVQRLFHNIEDARIFADLHHGDFDVIPVDEVDGKPVIDSFFVQAVINLTSFAALKSNFSYLSAAKSGNMTAIDSAPNITGVWSFNSHMNHSCLSNIRHSFIGDMQIIRAARDLEEGTEIFASYEYPVAFDSYDEAQKRLSNWSFKCSCALCLDRQATPKEVLLRRESLRMQFLESREHGAANLAEHQQFIEQLNQTYSPVAKLPGAVRVEVWLFYLTLGKVFFEMNNLTEAIEMTLRGLEALGFVISASPRRGISARATSEPEFRVLKWGLTQTVSVDAFLVLYQAYKIIAPQNVPAAKAYIELTYKMFVGENESILETYPELA